MVLGEPEPGEPIQEWCWLHEPFVDDFLPEIGGPEKPNLYGWQWEGGSGLHILEDASIARSGAGEACFLEIRGLDGQAVTLKRQGIRGGGLERLRTEFYVNFKDPGSAQSTGFPVAAFRDDSHQTYLGYVRYLPAGDGSAGLHLGYQGGEVSQAAVGIMTGTWYRIVFSFDAGLDEELELRVIDPDGDDIGVLRYHDRPA
jgi:hypothetical protein